MLGSLPRGKYNRILFPIYVGIVKVKALQRFCRHRELGAGAVSNLVDAPLSLFNISYIIANLQFRDDK